MLKKSFREGLIKLPSRGAIVTRNPLQAPRSHREGLLSEEQISHIRSDDLFRVSLARSNSRRNFITYV